MDAADRAGYWKALIDPLLARKWIICSDVLAAAGPLLERLRDLGAPKPFVLAGSVGTGEVPSEELAEMAVLGTSGTTIMGGLRAYHDALRDVPAPVLDRIEAWDPGREGRVLASWLDTDITIAGRASWGAAPPDWKRLEDKTTVDALWDAAGVPHAPVLVVPSRGDALVAAAVELDDGSGTVWVADNTEGWHGGGEYMRWVRDPHGAADEVAFFEERSRRARVMPFLDGIPCSIHGLVFPDAVAVFRPVEGLVLRGAGSSLTYAGTATLWDPPGDDREHMRTVARRVGTHLRETFGFRGAFTVDGVVTRDGFLPTELNPRPGAGLGALARGAESIPLIAIHRALVATEDLDYRPADLERVVVEAADRNRIARSLLVVSEPISDTEERPIAVHGTTVHFAEGSHRAGTITVGPSAQGGLVIVTVDAAALEIGSSFAPVAVSAHTLAGRAWDLAIGPLAPASEARRPGR